MPVIAGGGAQELHHGLPAPGALAVEQTMGIGLGDGIVHQLQAGVAAHEHLLAVAERVEVHLHRALEEAVRPLSSP